jgi:hypothetical protein
MVHESPVGRSSVVRCASRYQIFDATLLASGTRRYGNGTTVSPAGMRMFGVGVRVGVAVGVRVGEGVAVGVAAAPVSGIAPVA